MTALDQATVAPYPLHEQPPRCSQCGSMYHGNLLGGIPLYLSAEDQNELGERLVQKYRQQLYFRRYQRQLDEKRKAQEIEDEKARQQRHLKTWDGEREFWKNRSLRSVFRVVQPDGELIHPPLLTYPMGFAPPRASALAILTVTAGSDFHTEPIELLPDGIDFGKENELKEWEEIKKKAVQTRRHLDRLPTEVESYPASSKWHAPGYWSFLS